ncbi:MAG: serine protease [Polyangiaceae bacterium]
MATVRLTQTLTFLSLLGVGCAAAPAAGIDTATTPRPSIRAHDLVHADAASRAAADHAPTTVEIARRAGRMAVFVRSGKAYGAGVLLDDDGHVLTCDHVLMDGDSVSVRFEGEPDAITATVVDRDPALDLALLAIDEGAPTWAQPATAHGLGSVVELERGQTVYAMGSPRRMSFSFNQGMVSFSGRSFDDVSFLQTDLPMSPGSSGGPVLDDRGRLIGLASFIIENGRGLSFAIPVEYALERFSATLGRHTDATRLTAFRRWRRDDEATPVDPSPHRTKATVSSTMP